VVQVNFSSQTNNVMGDDGVVHSDSKATLTVDSPSVLVPWQAIPKLVSFFEDFNFFYLAYHKQRTAADAATRVATAALAEKAKAARKKVGKKLAKGKHQYFVKVRHRTRAIVPFIDHPPPTHTHTHTHTHTNKQTKNT
jgi:hypothetical protein